MAIAKRLAAYDSGYDKKFDSPKQDQAWLPVRYNTRLWSTFRKRRIIQFTVLLLVVYLFVRYLPDNLPTIGQRIDSKSGLYQGLAPPGEHANKDLLDRNQRYDGQVRFYNLAFSLQPHLHATNSEKRSLVFLLRDLQGASSLVQLACQTGIFNRTVVHLAVVSPQDTTISDIASLVGVNLADCPVYWHDARPDYNAQSSAARRVRTIQSAMDHLHASLQSAAFVLDETQLSDSKFKAIVQEKSMSLWTPLTIAPRDAVTSMDWITSLDGEAYLLLNSIRMDVLITAYHNSAGSLIRLLESIKNADYGGSPPPRITVELPQDVDIFAIRYLQDFRWPASGIHEGERLVLRRRLDSKLLSPASASTQLLEAFYPSSTSSHVLVLSSDVELSREYFQYLMYMISEYKHGSPGLNITDSLMGISLNLPEPYSQSADTNNKVNQNHFPFVTSHSPSSTATLYFGDKWTELQNYISLRFKGDLTLSKSVPGHANPSDKEPAWTRLASEFMTAQNKIMLYPAFVKDLASPLVTVHQEFHQSPEEYAKLVDNVSEKPASKAIPALKQDTVLVADEVSSHAHLGHKQMSKSAQSLRSRMGIKGYDPLPNGLKLPFVASDGSIISHEDAKRVSQKFADELSVSIGGCKSLGDRDESKFGGVEYLFCLYDSKMNSS